jgi:protein arginine kinase
VSVQDHLDDPFSSWMAGTGGAPDVVVSTRVRLARNLEGVNFPEHLSESAGEEVLQTVRRAVSSLPEPWEYVRLADLGPVDRRVLVEKHLISPQHAQGGPGAGLAFSVDEARSVMINEEDHLRIQVISPGLELEKTWREASQLDDQLEAKLDFAFDPELGYLTACPTNLGTGLRASVMVHLPGIVQTGQLARVGQALNKLGLAVRGLHGEGTGAVGHLFQISNQVTLGLSEDEVIQHLAGVAAQVIAEERAARQKMVAEGLSQLKDRVGRAYGILRHARLLDANEAMALLSDLRLGVEVGLWQGIPLRTLNELLVITLPGFLERKAGRALSEAEGNALRALLIQERLKASEGGM